MGFIVLAGHNELYNEASILGREDLKEKHTWKRRHLGREDTSQIKGRLPGNG